MTTTNGINQFDVARRSGVPILSINTTDPASTINRIKATHTAFPIAQWDVINGIQALTARATDAVTTMNRLPDGSINAALATGNPVEALVKAAILPDTAILFFHNAQLFMDKLSPGGLAAPIIQAVWNLRDTYKKTRKTLVLLSPSFPIPPELEHDVFIIDEALPSDTELASLIVRTFTTNGLKKPTKKLLPSLINATSGLAEFPIQQIISMSTTRTKSGTAKIDVDQLWKRKIDKINNVAGLLIHRTGPRFSDIGGNHNLKDLLLRVARSEEKPSLVVFLDEIEKALQAAGQDTSGVTTDQLKVLLTEMQNNYWTGLICYGFPGTAKSAMAKAFGREAGAITVEADLGAMKNIYVGSSEARMRAFVKIIKAMGGKKVFFFATCNQIEILRPELKRRFKKGIWFSDLPDRSEKDVIWDIYQTKFNIKNQERPDDAGWTGAEIENCCETANELKIPIKTACRFMTIVSQSMDVTKVRKAASGKYVSTQHPGIYQYREGQPNAV